VTIDLASVTFLIAALCAALMGYAIQRGATCTVAAVGEIVEKGSAKRLLALGEASLWVAGGLLIARSLGLIIALPGGFALSGWTVVGGALLGLGAWANRACVFGSIAKLGSGNWAYALTPIGFYAGAVGLTGLFGRMMPAPLSQTSAIPGWLALPFAIFAVWRVIGLIIRAKAGPRLSECIWAPHEATIIIAIAFVILFLAVGAWTYSELLVKLAEHMPVDAGWRLVLFVALLLGAILGGWTAGRLSSQMPTLNSLARCFAGGMLMGGGSILIPGGNDGLILVGMPFLMPYAWVAILTMCGTIWIALRFERATSHD
jgi:toxin CptA